MDVGSRFFHRAGSVDFLSEPYNVRQRYTSYLPDPDDATSFTPVARRPPQPSPIRRHSETPAEAARRRQARRAVVSNPIIGSDFDENNNESNVFSEAAEDVYTTDFIGSGLKKLRSNSWESLVRWEKENELLHAFIEDECEWLAELFPEEHGINPKHFFRTLQDGVVLVKLAEMCQNYAESYGLRNNIKFPFFTVTCHPHEKCNGPMGRFLSRENVDLFIRWCRAHKINECILFESNDVVEQDDTVGLREGAREIVLCLMELARYGVKFGMKAPKLIMLEKEIEYEEEMEHIDGSTSPRSCDSGVDIESDHFNLSYLGNDQYQVEFQDSSKCIDYDPKSHNYNEQQCTLCNVFGHRAEACDHSSRDPSVVFEVDERDLNKDIATKLMNCKNTISNDDENNNDLDCNDGNTMDSSTRELLNNRRNADLNNGNIVDDFDRNKCEDTTGILKESYLNGHTTNETKAFTSKDSVSSGSPSPTKKSKSSEASDSEVGSQRTPRRSSSNVSNMSKSDLHNIVTKIVEEYNIEKITRLKEGKYIILGKIMFVRLLNQHCIVRIGGGWDTLEHYILTHVNKSSVTEIDFKPTNEARKKKPSATQQHHTSNPDLSADPPKTPTGNSRITPLNARDPYIQEKVKRQRDDKLITDAISRVQADFLANHSPNNSTSPVRPSSAMDRRPNSSETTENLRPMSALAKIPSEDTVYQNSDDEPDPASNGELPAKSGQELDGEADRVESMDSGVLLNGAPDQQLDGMDHAETKGNLTIRKIGEDNQVLKNVVTTTITEVVKVTTDETTSPGSPIVKTEVLATKKSVSMETKSRKKKDNERESGRTSPKTGSKTVHKPPKSSSRPSFKQALLPSKPKTTKTVSKIVEGGKTTIKTQTITKVGATSPTSRLTRTSSNPTLCTSRPVSPANKPPTTVPKQKASGPTSAPTKPVATPLTSKLKRTSSNPTLCTNRPVSPATKPPATAPKQKTLRPTSAPTKPANTDKQRTSTSVSAGPKPTSTDTKAKAPIPISASSKPSLESKADVQKPPSVVRQPRPLSLTAKPTRTSSLRLAKSAEASGRSTSAPATPSSPTKKITTQPTGTKPSPVGCETTKSLSSTSRQRTGSLKRQESVSKSSTDLLCTSRHNSIDNSTLTRRRKNGKDEQALGGNASNKLDSSKRDQKCLKSARSTPSLTTSTQKNSTRKGSEKLQQRPCKPFLTGSSGSRHSSVRNEAKPPLGGTCNRSKSVKKNWKPASANDSKTTGTCAPPACKNADKTLSRDTKSKTSRSAKPTTTTKESRKTDLDGDKDGIVATARTGNENDDATAVNGVVDCDLDSDLLCQHSSSVIDQPVTPRTDKCAEENLNTNSLTKTTTATTITTTTTTLTPDPKLEYPHREGPSDGEIGSAVVAKDSSDSANRTEEVIFVDSEAMPSGEVRCEKHCTENDTSPQHNAFQDHMCRKNDVLTQQNDVNVSSFLNGGAGAVGGIRGDHVTLNDAIATKCELRSHSYETLCEVQTPNEVHTPDEVQTSDIEDVELVNGSDFNELRRHVRDPGDVTAPPRTAWGVTGSL